MKNNTQVDITDIRVGMKIHGWYRSCAFAEWLRIEAIGYDWIVGRSEAGDAYLLNVKNSSPFTLYEEDIK